MSTIRRHTFHGRDRAITTALNGGDDGRAETLAQGADLYLYVALLDHHVGPSQVHSQPRHPGQRQLGLVVQVGVGRGCQLRLGGRERMRHEGLNRLALCCKDGVSARGPLNGKEFFNTTFRN